MPKFAGNLLHRLGLLETDADDRVVAATGEIAQCLFALRSILDLKSSVLLARFLREPFCTVERCFVEALVELSTEIEDNRRSFRGALSGGQRLTGHQCDRCHSAKPSFLHI